MKNPSNRNGNQTRDFRACSAVPQPTAQPHIPYQLCYTLQINLHWKPTHSSTLALQALNSFCDRVVNNCNIFHTSPATN
jgi:hypothetical protein